MTNTKKKIGCHWAGISENRFRVDLLIPLVSISIGFTIVLAINDVAACKIVAK